jgi:hypothetical protein
MVCGYVPMCSVDGEGVSLSAAPAFFDQPFIRSVESLYDLAKDSAIRRTVSAGAGAGTGTGVFVGVSFRVLLCTMQGRTSAYVCAHVCHMGMCAVGASAETCLFLGLFRFNIVWGLWGL